MKQVQAVEGSTSASAGRRIPRRRALLGISGLLVIGTVAAACGSSSGTPTTSRGKLCGSDFDGEQLEARNDPGQQQGFHALHAPRQRAVCSGL